MRTRRRPVQSRRPQPRPACEPLEVRRFCCGVAAVGDEASHGPAPAAAEADGAAAVDVTPPVVTDVRFLGRPTDATGLVVTFSEPMDPQRARRVSNYELARTVVECSIEGGTDFDDPTVTVCETNRYETDFDAATYDEATRSAALLPEFRTFNATTQAQLLTVNAGPERGLTDLAGNRLDGNANGVPGGDARWRLRFSAGRTINYREADGDRVRIRLRGGGTLRLLRRVNENGGTLAALQLWVGPRNVSARSVLSATVIPSARGDGRTTLGEIAFPGDARLELLQNPAVTIGRVTP